MHASSLPNFAPELALPLSVQAALEGGAGAGAGGGVGAAAVQVQRGLRREINMVLVFMENSVSSFFLASPWTSLARSTRNLLLYTFKIKILIFLQFQFIKEKFSFASL